METNKFLPGSSKPSFQVNNGAKIVTDDIIIGILFPCSPTV